MAKLGDICDVRDGTHDSPSYVDTGYPLVTSKNIVDGKLDLSVVNYITPDDYNKINERSKVDDGDIIMPMIGTIGNPYLVNGFTDFAIKNVALIKFNNEQVNNRYIYHFLNSDKFKEYIAENNRGGTQKFLSLKDIRNMEINIVPLGEQLQIVAILDKISSLIKYRQEQLSKLDELVKSRFIELFGDPNLNNKDWEKGVINNIGTCVAGATPSTQVKEYWENGTIPWMSSGEVNKGRVYETDTKITQLGYDNASTKLVPPKTVVLAMAGQGKTRGTAAITEIELCTNQSICSIVNNENVNAEYLLYFLKLQYMELREASTNTDGRGGLNLKIIGNYPIMIPPIELQNQFAAFVEQTDKSKLVIQQNLEKLETLKKALMQQYFG